MDIKRILVPPVAGLFSALGLLFADVEHQVIAGFYRELDSASVDELNGALEPMVAEAEALLEGEGFATAADRRVEVIADMKYVGQTWTLAVALPGYPADGDTHASLTQAFGDMHEQTYGYRSDTEKVQIVALKVIGRGIAKAARVPKQVARAKERISESGRRNAYYGPEEGWIETEVLPRVALSESPVDGPLIVEEYDTTSVVRPGWRAWRDGWNNIGMERG